MKTKAAFLIVLLSFMVTAAFSQEKSKKELKAERKLEQQKQVETMVNAREFVFVARIALPSGGRSVNLSGNPNYLKFQPEMIESEMPFFGRAYSSVGYGGDTGMKFSGKPDEFKVVKGKKNYQIDVTVTGTNDRYKLNLQVSLEGSASLVITSNNRSTISYQGDISPVEKQEGKK